MKNKMIGGILSFVFVICFVVCVFSICGIEVSAANTKQSTSNIYFANFTTVQSSTDADPCYYVLKKDENGDPIRNENGSQQLEKVDVKPTDDRYAQFTYDQSATPQWTLTLHNFSIEAENTTYVAEVQYWYGVINADMDLRIVLEGDNQIVCIPKKRTTATSRDWYTTIFAHRLYIEGDGKLNAVCRDILELDISEEAEYKKFNNGLAALHLYIGEGVELEAQSGVGHMTRGIVAFYTMTVEKGAKVTAKAGDAYNQSSAGIATNSGSKSLFIDGGSVFAYGGTVHEQGWNENNDNCKTSYGVIAGGVEVLSDGLLYGEGGKSEFTSTEEKKYSLGVAVVKSGEKIEIAGGSSIIGVSTTEFPAISPSVTPDPNAPKGSLVVDNGHGSCRGEVDISHDFTVNELVIHDGANLIIEDGYTITVAANGTIQYADGEQGTGTITNNGIIDNYGDVSVKITNASEAAFVYVNTGSTMPILDAEALQSIYFQIDDSKLKDSTIKVTGGVKWKENGDVYALYNATVDVVGNESFTLFVNDTIVKSPDPNSLTKYFTMPAEAVVLSYSMLQITPEGGSSPVFRATATVIGGKQYESFTSNLATLNVNCGDAFTVRFVMDYITDDLKFELSNVPVGTKLLLINVTPNWNSQVFYAEIKAPSECSLPVSQFIKIGTTDETNKNIQGTNVIYQLIVILPQRSNAAMSGMTVQVNLDGVASNAVTINAQKNSETVAVNSASAMEGTVSASIKVSQTSRTDNVVAVELLSRDGKPCDFPAGASIKMGNHTPVRVVGNVAFFSDVSDGEYTVTLNMKEGHMDGGASYQLKISLCSDASDGSDASYPMANVVNDATKDVNVAPYVRHAISVESDSRYATNGTTFKVNYIGTVADNTSLSVERVQYRAGTKDTFKDVDNLTEKITIEESPITENGVKTSEVTINNLDNGIYVITFTYGEATYLYAFVVTS